MAGYNFGYTYVDNSQKISNIVDNGIRYTMIGDTNPNINTCNTQNYGYDANGNLVYVNAVNKTVVVNAVNNTTDWKLQGSNSRKLLWDEENRLISLSDNGFVSNYFYDAAGERTVKESGDNEGVQVIGVLSGAQTGTTNFTAYISPNLVLNTGGYYTKHIYMGSQRIVSKLSSSDIFGTNPTDASLIKAGSKDFSAKFADLTSKIKVRYDSLGVTNKGVQQSSANLITSSTGLIKIPEQYFYHSDHLGSSSIITNISIT